MQKSKVAGRLIFLEITKREAIADSYSVTHISEVACEFNVRRRGPPHLYTNIASAARRIFDHQCKTTFATQSAQNRHANAAAGCLLLSMDGAVRRRCAKFRAGKGVLPPAPCCRFVQSAHDTDPPHSGTTSLNFRDQSGVIRLGHRTAAWLSLRTCLAPETRHQSRYRQRAPIGSADTRGPSKTEAGKIP